MKRRLRNGGVFQRNSFQFMLSISFSLVALIGMLFIGISLYIPYYRSTMETVDISQRQVLEQANSNLDQYLRNMMRISDTMYYKVIKSKNLLEENLNTEMDLLYDAYKDSLVSIAVFNDGGRVVCSNPLSRLKSSESVTKTDWFIKAKSQIENAHFSTPHVQDLFDNSDFRFRWVVSLSRAVEMTYGGTIQNGVLLVDMNFSGIEQICRKVNLGASGYVYIINSEGEIIYHPNQQLIYANLKNENNIAAAGYKDGSRTEVFEGLSRFVTVKTVGYTGWKIVGVSYMGEVGQYTQIAASAILIGVLIICAVILINGYISSRIATPINTLERFVRDIDRGKLNIDVEVGGTSEIQHLGSAINAMLKQIRNLMDDIVWEQEQKRKSELDALQAQINPHFLYNVLDSIVWMIENENYQQAVVMVSALSRVFHISISRGKTIIPVSSELEHVRNYLTIQHIRFKDKFTYTIESTDEAAGMETIKLIVQPIVENAIHHGMAIMQDDDGEVAISANVKNGDLFIEVKDNGPGMPEETAQSLLRAPTARASGGGSGIGLYNVQKRIELYFGAEYGLTIDSVPDKGTRVTIHLPARPFSEGGL